MFALCARRRKRGRGRMEKSGSAALQFGTALDRSKSKLTIPIATATAASSAPSFVCLRTSFLQIVLRLLAVTVWQILRRWTDFPPIPFLTALNSYLNRFSRILILTTCVVIYGSAADIRPPLSRESRCGPPTGSRVPLLVPSLICCISDLAFGVTNKKTLQDTV